MDSLHSLPVPQSSIFHLFGQQSFLSFHVFMITHPGTVHRGTTITIFEKKKTKHGGYKDNRRRVLTFNTLTAQKRQNMCGDVQVTFSARYWVQVYLAELISDRVSSVEWGAKWGVGPSLFRTYFGREMFGSGLPMVGTYTEILETSWVAMKAIVVDPCIKYY